MIANAVPSLEQHPYRRMREAGLLAALNTDDPALTDLDLGREYQSCMEAFGYRWEDMVAIALDGVEATWLDESDKRELGRGSSGRRPSSARSSTRTARRVVRRRPAMFHVERSASPSGAGTPTMCSRRTGTRVRGRPVAARMAATMAGVEEIVGGSPMPRGP